MIISGYERPVEYGRLLIFDPTMAAMVLQALQQYNAALKDEYEKGLKDLADFNTKYGDFISPFSKDMDRYGEMISGIRNVLDEAYSKGINLTLSPQGRMIIQRLTNSINPAEFNIMRTNAKLGFEYLDAIEKAKAKNEFSQEFEDYLLTHGGPGLFNDFSSKNGMWNRPGPGRYQTIDELIEPIVKNVDYTFDEAMTKSKNDGNNYYSITRDRLAKAVNDNMSDILATLAGGFHYWKALQAAGGDKKLATEILNLLIGNRLSDHEKVKFEADPFKLDDRRTRNDISAAWAKEAARSYYDILPYADENGDGKLSKEERAKFAKIKNGQTLDSESWTKRLRDDIKDGMNVYANAVNLAKVGVTFNGAKKQLISEGVKNPSTKQVNERIAKNKLIYLLLINQMTNSKGLTGENLSYLNAYYNAYQTKPTGEDAKTALALAADLADPEAINDILSNHKRLPIMFESDGSLNLTRQREAAYAGVSLTRGSATNQLYDYLSSHGIEGFIPNNDVTINRMPYGNYGVWDINFTGRFRKQDLAKFKGAGSDKFYNTIANAGGRYVTSGGKVIIAEEGDDKGKIKWSDIEYIDLPVSRTIDERKHTSWQIDDYHRRRVYGLNNAAKAALKSND